MIKAAIIFGIVALVPLAMAFLRFNIQETDNEAQVMIKQSMKQTQIVIACIFLVTGLILLSLSFFIQDMTLANGITVALYVVALVSSVGYAVLRQIQLQKRIRELFKK